MAPPQGVSLQDLLLKLRRPFKEYELWALSHACLSTLRMHHQHPGDALFCASLFCPCGTGVTLGERLLWTQDKG